MKGIMTTRTGLRERMKLTVSMLSLILLLLPAGVTGHTGFPEKELQTGEEVCQTVSGSPSTDAARTFLISEDFDRAVSEYALLLKKDPTDAVVNSEYAYALALNGIYDAALARLDKVWNNNSNNREVNYFTSQVFALMGYDALATEFRNRIAEKETPVWISSAAPLLLEKYSDRSPGNDLSGGVDIVTFFRRANRLTAQDYNLMAIASFEAIVTEYPGEYLPYLGYSIALEKAGIYSKSIQALEQAMTLVRDKPEQTEAQKMIEQRLVQVRSNAKVPVKSVTTDPTNLKPAAGGKRMLAYAGGMFSSSYISINGRFGTFISDSGSLSADIGLAKSGESTSLNLGIMNFYRRKVFVAGYGLNAGLGSQGLTLYFKISVGLSFMNKARSSSWDIFLDGQQPIAPSGSTTTMGMSVGRSIYFGTR